MSATLPPDQTQPPPPPPPQPPRRRLLRSRTDRVLAGVAGGLGRHLDIDPVIVRIAFVALALFGGAGVLLYLAAALLVPAEDPAPGDATSAVAPPPGERNRALVVLGIVALVLIAGPLLLGPALIAGGLLVPLTLIVLAGLVVAWLVTGERPEGDATSLVRATVIGLGVLALCWVLAAGAFWAAAAGGEAVVAGLVIAAGVALVASAFARPARWLVLPALAVAVTAAFVAATGIELDGGYGERTYRPGTAAELADRYELAAGRLVVDLRDAELPAGDRPLALDVGIGEAVLVVPEDVCVATDASLGIGGVDVFDRNAGGIDVDLLDAPEAEPGATRLLVDADVGVGHLDVRATDPDSREFRFGDRGGPLFETDGRGTNAGCA